MADIWTDLEADVAALMSMDGEVITVTTDSGDHSLSVMWIGDSWEGGNRAGPWSDCALADLPSDLALHRSTCVRDGTTYTLVGWDRDGAGWSRLIWREEAG